MSPPKSPLAARCVHGTPRMAGFAEPIDRGQQQEKAGNRDGREERKQEPEVGDARQV
jgi:hypothetical protein